MTPTTLETQNSHAEALRGLRERLGDRISFAPEDLNARRSDFGRMADRLPGALALCRTVQEVAEVIRYCREHRLPVVPRGEAHTQSGQATSQGGVLLDTSAMRQILEIDAEALTATVEAGVVWRDLVLKATEQNLVP